MKSTDLTKGPVASKLLRLTLPMLMGMFAMMTFNLADTYFISRLGTEELAAMTFTFPVIMVIISIALGIGVGMSSVISRVIGNGDPERVRR
ncbi:MAG: MATE family efflux transporter, partial [Candidatus Omnitrophica bacterium]|nr:MATE family efflux transporter [Candidatus Omnitrophota bacterium]